MPDDLVCPTCGRVYPWQVPREYCLSCRTPFTRGTCYVCRQYKEKIALGKCSDCSRVINRKSCARHRAAAKDTYQSWLKEIVDIPKPIKALTEDEWLNTCKHFGGCAMCGDYHIEARLMFIPSHRGGTYTRFNVLPGCEVCATAYRQTIKSTSDPFSTAFYNGLAADRQRMEVIKKYLKEQYDEYRKSNGI